ncbi:hypothetical protein [uncultured Sphingomonas sp.]|uniref:hypothetical protein n=1 Tax=uncultured Sphingomonas sp. TaxID=158754 RepID=UPI0035CC0633
MFGVASALALVASLALFWPGISLYDTVAQYGQVLSGEYDDWHPPAMAWLWAALHGIVGGGATPMLVGQMASYWLGFGLIAAGLGAIGRRRAGWAVLAIAAWPPFLGWQAAVLKDAQMTGAMLASVGLVGWWRLRGRRVPAAAWAAVAVLLCYAVLVRANAVFAVVPLAVMLVPGWKPLARSGAGLAGIVGVLAVSGPINHDLLGAQRSGVERTEAIYDLAGIAVRVPDAPGLPIDRAAIAALIKRHCVKGFFWDPLGEPDRCNGVVEPLRHIPPGTLYATLARMIAAHPLAYAGHRLTHLNSTDRWMVCAGWSSAAPPMTGQPNDLGLGDPDRAAAGFEQAAGRLIDVPFAWPVAWIVVAATAWVIAVLRPAEPARDLSLALSTSALAMEGSFAVISIASDLRYHLWSMIAAALAALLVADGTGRGERRVLLVGASVLTLVVAAGVMARIRLPAPPESYIGMLAW